MSKKPAAIPLFGDAYLADTRHLTTEEHGAYLLLIMSAWRQEDCALPHDDKKLARIVGLTTRRWASIKPTIMEFWQVEDGRVFQKRLRKERAFVDRKSEQNTQSAEARWAKQPIENITSGKCKRMSERNAPPPSPSQERVEEEEAKASPSSARTKKLDPFPMPEWADPQVWSDFLTNRRKKSRPNTPTAHKRMLSDIAKLTNAQWPPGRLLEHAAAQGWAGIYEPRDDQNGRKNIHGSFISSERGKDGVAAALDRQLGLDDAPDPFGRRDAGAGQGVVQLRIASSNPG